MVTRPRKVLSILLASTMIASMCMLPTAVSAADTTTESSNASSLAKYYSTNATGKGVNKTITIDGDASDWSEDMMIAQGAAWDIANHWKGGHENCVLDTYALFAAWDDSNLYVGWQMVNTTDTWARSGDGPLSDGGRVLDVPLILALSIDPSSTSMSNKNTSGGSIWGQKMGLEFDTHVDRLLYMSGKPGLGEPSMFKAVDANGNTDYTAGSVGFAEGGIEYKMATTNICSSIMGLNNSDDPSDVTSDSADWVDYKTFSGSAGKHDTTYDSFYEIKIPFSTLGITKEYIEGNGIGAMLVATRGESALDCIPYDLSMVDNATGDYSSDPSTSAEKDDIDVITASLAKIGGDGTPVPVPTQKTTEAVTQKTTQQATEVATSSTTTTTKSKSVTVEKGDVVTLNLKATSSTKKITAYRLTTEYSSSAFSLDTSYSSDGVNTLGASSGTEAVNTSTAGVIKTAVLASSNYDISSGKNLQTIKLKAKKAGTYTIKYTVDELLDTSSKDLATNGKVNSAVTMAVSSSIAKATVPTTGTTTATVKSGDTVTLSVNLTTATALYGFKTDINYDSTLLSVSKVEFPNFSDGTTLANTDTAGKISTVGVGSPTRTYNYKAGRCLVRVTFKATKAGTASFSYLMKEVIGLDAVNQFDESTGKSTVSTTTSSISAKVTTSTTVDYIGSLSKSIKVAKGDVVVYTVKAKTSSKFNKYVLTTKYDSSAFSLYTNYSKDGVNTIVASQGGKEVVDTATAGTISTTATAATNSPYTAATATNIQIVKFTAKKAGTFTISSTLDSMLDDTNTALTSSKVSLTGSASVAEVDTSKVAGVSKSIQVKAGEVIVYTVKAKTTSKFKTYTTTVTYDSSAFERYTAYSTDGVTTIKLNQGGTESVNTKTDGKIVATATFKSGSPYVAKTASNLLIVKLKAKKAGTFTIGATVNSMTNNSGVAMTGNDVTITNTASVVIPFTESNSITVTKGQVVNYYVTVTLPNTGNDISGWTVDMNYDSDLFDVVTTFANKNGFAVGSAAINYATGTTTTKATLPGGTLATASFNPGTVTILDINSKGLSLKGKTTKLVCIQLKAKKAGTGILSYSVKNFVDTKSTTTYINSKYQAVNGATFKMTASKVS